MRRALFLDRDGVINVDYGYVGRKEDFHFVDGIFELCRAAKAHGYCLFVITNQAGIGRGYYSEQDFQRLTSWMCEVFRAEGAEIDKVYYCPDHPEHGIGEYRKASEFRKPNPGMILQAAREFGLDLPGSILLGDTESDIAAGRAAQVGVNLLYFPHESSPSGESSADAVVQSFDDVLRCLQRA